MLPVGARFAPDHRPGLIAHAPSAAIHAWFGNGTPGDASW
jgi:hypothetical protein